MNYLITKLLNYSRRRLALILLAVTIGLTVAAAVLGWSNPTQAPPGGNPPAPINVGSDTQTKSGGLNIMGNVGIGTTAPAAKLQVVGGAIMPAVGNSASAGIYFPPNPGGGSGDEAFIRYYVESGENTKLLIGINNDLDDDISFYQAGAERLTIYNGNVGIGTTAPPYKFVVDSSLATTTDPDYGSIMSLRNPALPLANGDTRFLDFGSLNVSTAFIRPAGRNLAIIEGNVGIGTTGPTHKLEVNSSADWLTAKFDSPGPWTAIKMRAGNTLVNTLGLYMHYGGTGAGDNNQFRLGRANPNDPNMGWFGANPVIFDLDAPDSTFVVQGDGNVGIGAYSPWSKLSIEQSGGNSGVGIHRPGVSAGGVAAGLQNTAGISVFSNWWGGFSGEPIRFGWAPWNGDWNTFTEVMRIHTNGNVGIGTTAPGAAEKLAVALSTGQGVRLGPWGNDGSVALLVSTATTTQEGLTIRGASGQTATLLRVDVAGGTPGLLVNNNGNVGIGTTAPTGKLHVAGSGASGAGIFMENTGGGRTWRITSINAGSLTFFDVTGAYESMNLTSTGTLTVGGGSGKINVGTVDPIYKIGGRSYATYAAFMTGQKEETTGTLNLSTSDVDKGAYRAVIDFNKAEKGSDLWLFWQITDFGTNWENLVALLTPSFNGRVWYAKDPSAKKLFIYGSQSGEVSYRLTAPRFDHAKWPNTSTDDADGFTLPEK